MSVEKFVDYTKVENGQRVFIVDGYNDDKEYIGREGVMDKRLGVFNIRFDDGTEHHFWTSAKLKVVEVPAPDDIVEYQGEKWRRVRDGEKWEKGDRLGIQDNIEQATVLKVTAVGETYETFGDKRYAWRKVSPTYVPPPGWRLMGRDEVLTNKCRIRWEGSMELPVDISVGKTTNEVQETSPTHRIDYAICPIEETKVKHKECHDYAYHKLSSMDLPCRKCRVWNKWTPKTSSTPKPVTTYVKGMRVVRGKDWRWGDQDGHGPGTVTGGMANKTVNVKWDMGDSCVARIGLDDRYDLYELEGEKMPFDYKGASVIGIAKKNTMKGDLVEVQISGMVTVPFGTYGHDGSDEKKYPSRSEIRAKVLGYLKNIEEVLK